MLLDFFRVLYFTNYMPIEFSTKLLIQVINFELFTS